MPDPVIVNLPPTVDPPPNRRQRRHPGNPAVPKLALTIEEACESLTISRPTLYELIGSGRIRTVMVGRRRLIPVTELERLLAEDS